MICITLGFHPHQTDMLSYKRNTVPSSMKPTSLTHSLEFDVKLIYLTDCMELAWNVNVGTKSLQGGMLVGWHVLLLSIVCCLADIWDTKLPPQESAILRPRAVLLHHGQQNLVPELSNPGGGWGTHRNRSVPAHNIILVAMVIVLTVAALMVFMAAMVIVLTRTGRFL